MIFIFYSSFYYKGKAHPRTGLEGPDGGVD